MAKAVDPSPPVLVESQTQLDEACAQLAEQGRLGFDTEFVMEDRFQSDLCLVQLAGEQDVYLVDPLLDLDLAPVWALICDRRVETIVHAGQEDLALCYQHAHEVPRNVFDAQIAAGLVGFDYPVSLQRLVDMTTGVRLRKGRTLTDWRRRPLTDDQVHYAAGDVRHLLAVRKALHRKLTRHKRLAWAREEFRRFEAAELYDQTPEERLTRVKGMGALSARQLAIARHMLTWRDTVAEQRNRPARTVLKDHLLLEIARHQLTSPEDISSLRGLNLSRKDLQSLCEIVKEAAALPREAWPVVKERQPETPWETALVSLLTGILRAHCLHSEIAYSLCATKKSIADLVRHYLRLNPDTDEAPELLTGWRGEAVGSLLDRLLRGQVAVSLAPDQHPPRLTFDPPEDET